MAELWQKLFSKLFKTFNFLISIFVIVKIRINSITPRLGLGHKQCVALATRVRLGKEYAAFFLFSAGIEYEFYDSCVKKSYIALVNSGLCEPARFVCRT